MLNLASNNYLGLAGDPRLKEAAIQAIQDEGVGSTASRLIVGNHPLYQKAEQALIRWKGAEAGLILQNGYMANVGIISSLVNQHSVVFSDKLNHASIVDGIRLSQAEHRRYRHLDLNHLESLLKKTPKQKRKLIVTDSVFSMDGDIAHFERLVQLKEEYQAILMVDEAHSSGIFGAQGQGLVNQFRIEDQVDIQMGTFSKALGSYGAYVVGKKVFIDYLVNKMRPFIFSTALPPGVLGPIIAAIKIVQEEQERRTKLLQMAQQFRRDLEECGFHLCGSQSQIVPILIGTNEKTLSFSYSLQQEGIAAIAIRPPTVPENQARIRFTLTAVHNQNDLDWAIQKIKTVGYKLGVIS